MKQGWHLYLIKFVDLLDTVFFVLRKKQNQVSFLHVFHHAGMCLIYFWGLNNLYHAPGFYMAIGFGVNTMVHVIMYSYYCLAAFGPHMQKYLWWKRHLTRLQIVFERVDVSVCVKLDKIELRDVIKYSFLKNNTPAQIKDELDSVYENSAPSFNTVKFWAAEFKRGRKSLGDDERSGHPNTATTDENIAEVHQMVLDDHGIKVREITEIMSMLKNVFVTY
ncbi:elongation of very long chain fatty acids protein 4 [Trichonephila clavipes]|nr:elongation of very long chain fatty acids protein 4 [Trichonephila clavipes]